MQFHLKLVVVLTELIPAFICLPGLAVKEGKEQRSDCNLGL